MDRTYRALHLEQIRVKKKSYYFSNVERERNIRRDYYHANREHLIEKCRFNRRSNGQMETVLHILDVMKKLKTEGGT